MITLPETAPPAADLRSGRRFLLRVIRQQRRMLMSASALSLLWMLGDAAAPVILGRTIDAGLLGRDGGALVLGCLGLLGVIVLSAFTGTWAHRMNVISWMTAVLRTQQQVGHHIADHGLAVSRQTTTGEVIETIGPDSHKVGEFTESLGRAIAAVITYPIVVIVILRIDVIAGIWVAVGLPLMTALLAVLIRPLQSREREQRQAMSKLAALGSDTAAGLRVLRGIGGERQFVNRYREGSQDVRRKGTNVARAWALVELAQVGLPGTFVVVLIWLGAQGVLTGRLSGGELVTLYGSAAFLRTPIDVMGDMLFNLIGARIGSDRIVTLLRRRDTNPADGDTAAGDGAVDDASPGTGVNLSASAEPVTMPGPDAELLDPGSGVRLTTGQLTALVSAVPEQSTAIAERMAGLAPGRAQLGGVPLARLAPGDVRQRIQFNEAEPRLFSGTLRTQLDPSGRHDDDTIIRALAAADAIDVLDSLPERLETQVEERGRSFSGGQRQRLALARALLGGSDVLMLIEPTSAVDAHTEARVAQRLRRARAGRTTLVTTASPLLLAECDRVLFLDGDHVGGSGTHRELMRTSATYRQIVARDLSDDISEPAGHTERGEAS